MKQNKTITSAISPLKPVNIINTKTGEYVNDTVLQNKIGQVSNIVLIETNRLYEVYKENLFTLLTAYKGYPKPAEYARQHNIKTNFVTALPTEVKVKSRLEKLVQFKLISETASFVLNPNPDKKEPVFGSTFNLGAVDKQMVTLSFDETCDELNLLWKCWDTEYYVNFVVPKYVLQRDVVKFTLPLIRLSKKTGLFEFIFNIVENVKPRKGNKHVIGIDLGLNKPYSMVVVNQNGYRVASYETTSRLIKLTWKRERLIIETRAIQTKIRNRATRGLTSPVQEKELEFTSNKTTRLTKTVALQTGAEIANKLAKHNSNLIKIENLTWVSGHKTSKIGSSCWSHSAQQKAITHATARIGYTVKKINPYNTSQVCHKCKTKITHNNKTRTVWCVNCKTKLDRDFNAAMNIATKTFNFPVSKKLNGGITNTISGTTSIGSKAAFIGTFVTELPHIVARKTT